MKLLIISHTPHYKKKNVIVGWGPTVREIDSLASLFDKVVHIAPIYPATFDENAMPYSSPKVFLRFVNPSGGEHILEKLKVLWNVPHYLIVILQELFQADVVHVRCPANLGLLAIMILAIVGRPHLRWVKYAGSWHPDVPVPFTSKFQRWWLSQRLHRGLVTVNGCWPNQPAHVKSFYNPCLDDDILPRLRNNASKKELTYPINILFAGRLQAEKGAIRVIQIAKLLLKTGIPFHLNIFGDGPELASLNELARNDGVRSMVKFHGWKAQQELLPFYLDAHFVLLPSDSEGWPKVLSEGMACGAVPIASRVGSIQGYLEQFGIGKTCKVEVIHEYVDAIQEYCRHPNDWKKESILALESAHLFTYEFYLNQVSNLLWSNSYTALGKNPS